MSSQATASPRKTTCYQCDMNCAFDPVRASDGRLIRLDGPACPRGAVQMEMLNHPERLRQPQLKVPRGGGFEHVPISWEEALDRMADALQGLKARHGAESVAFFSGYTKEARPHLQRLAHLFGSPNYMTESGCCFTATLVSEQLTYGYRLKTSSLLEAAETRCRLIWSTNPAHSVLPYGDHPIVQPHDQIKTIVVDPRVTEAAQRADLHLAIRPGTDGALALGIHNLLFENGWVNASFLAEWGNGVEAFRDYAATFTPARVAEICWIPEADLRQAAEWYGTRGPAQLVLSATSTTQHGNGFQNHRALILLAATSGNVDIPGGNRFYLEKVTPKPIDLFDELIGQLPSRVGAERFPIWTNRYPAAHCMRLGDAIARADPYPIRGLFALGINSLMWPNTRRFEESLEQLDFFACVDFFHNPATRLADLVLPAAASLEREALITASTCQFKGMVQYRPVLEPPLAQCRADAQIVIDLGCRLGMADQFWRGDLSAGVREQAETLPPKLWEEIQARPEGVSVLGESLMSGEFEATERIYVERGFPTRSGKVEFYSEELAEAGYDGLPVYREPAESPLASPALAQDFPLVLTTGGRSIAYTHSQQRRFASLRRRDPHPRVQINPADAADRGIASGDWVDVSSPRGRVTFLAEVTERMRSGVVHCFHGWEEANANLLTDDVHLDPISGFPPFKSGLCQVARVAP